jgi:hypothetical protein
MLRQASFHPYEVFPGKRCHVDRPEEAPRLWSRKSKPSSRITLHDSLWLSAGWGQFFESVAIQRFASSSVAKLPTRETGPYPVLMATVQRPSLIIFEWNFGFSLIPKIRACSKMVRSQFDQSFETTRCCQGPWPLHDSGKADGTRASAAQVH